MGDYMLMINGNNGCLLLPRTFNLTPYISIDIEYRDCGRGVGQKLVLKVLSSVVFL